MIKLIKTVALSLATIILLYSCKKDEVEPVSRTIEELLTSKTWKADELRIQLSNNTTQYYKRGVSGNTYDSDSLKFTNSNTGTYYFSGSAYPITWNFTDAAKSKMTVVINQPPTPLTVYLENIHITETYFKYSQYNLGSGLTYMASGTRVPN